MRQLDPFPEQCEQRTNQGVISDILVFYLSKRERYLYTVVLLNTRNPAPSQEPGPDFRGWLLGEAALRSLPPLYRNLHRKSHGNFVKLPLYK